MKIFHYSIQEIVTLKRLLQIKTTALAHYSLFTMNPAQFNSFVVVFAIHIIITLIYSIRKIEWEKKCLRFLNFNLNF